MFKNPIVQGVLTVILVTIFLNAARPFSSKIPVIGKWL